MEINSGDSPVRPSSAQFRALLREATSAAEHIGAGVTALGKANYAQTAYYSQALFALSVGFERSGKLAFALGYLCEHGVYPAPEEFRALGHNLGALLTRMQDLSAKYGAGLLLPNSTIHNAAIATLSQFATNVTRYYNLEVLAGEDPKLPFDPIGMWNAEVTEPVLEKHYGKRARERDRRDAQTIEEMVGSFTLVRHETETGRPITNAYEGAIRTSEFKAARKWERVYVLQIARFVAEALIELQYAAMKVRGDEIPFLSEIFGIYLNDDRYFLTRSTWSIYP